jgi:hypothetical protein
MISLGELLKSPYQQQKHDAYVVFPAMLSNTYNRKGYPSYSKILHLGRGNILKGSIVALCNHAIGSFTSNLLMENWEIMSVSEIIKDPRLYRGSFCRRCVSIIGI